MADLTLRSEKGSWLTSAEADGNIIELAARAQAANTAAGAAQTTANTALALAALKVPLSSAATGVNIDFTGVKIFNSNTSPATGNITNTLADAKPGLIQKIYHNHISEPTYPAGWVKVGNGIYAPGQLNIIFAEWVSGTRVEYWISQTV